MFRVLTSGGGLTQCCGPPGHCRSEARTGTASHRHVPRLVRRWLRLAARRRNSSHFLASGRSTAKCFLDVLLIVRTVL